MNLQAVPLNSGQCSENSVRCPLQTAFGPDHGMKHAGGEQCHHRHETGGGAFGAVPPVSARDEVFPQRVSDRGQVRTRSEEDAEHCFLNTGHCSEALPGDPISIVDR